MIFEGQVIDLWYEDLESEPGLAVTRIVVDTSLQYKGAVESGRILLTLPGGIRSDGAHISVAGTPSVDLGDQVLVHALAVDEERAVLANWSLGLMKVVVTDYGEAAVVDAQG